MTNEYTATEVQCIASQDEARYMHQEVEYHMKEGLMERAIAWQRQAHEGHKVMTQDLDHLIR